MNVSNNPGRNVQQQEQIGRRESIIAPRRDTRAPQLERNQDLRSARRGDVAGAEALMRTLGMAEAAGTELQTYLTNKNALDEQDNIAQGSLDAQAGTVDEGMMGKSLGYRNAVTKGRTVNAFSDASRAFDDELKQMIEGQDSPILEERLAEINERIEGFFTNFAQDPETGQLREYLQSPGAMRYLAETIQTTRPKALAAAQEMVEEGFKKEAFGHFNKNVINQARDTGTVDLVAARSMLPDIVTDEEFADNAFIAVANAARALEDDNRLPEAAALLAGLRQRTRTPIASGVGAVGPTGAASSASSSGLSATGAAGQFATALKGVGLSDAVIAGFLGNIEHESSFDSSRVGDSGTAFGHVQWRADRVDNFKRIVGTHPQNATPEQSVQFIKWELDNPRAAGMTKNQRDLILNAETPEEAARAIDKYYERSNGKSTRDRMQAARRFFGTQAEPVETPAAAEGGTPLVRLTNPNADPITLLEQSGEMIDIIGIEDVQFSPSQVAQIDELYAQSTERMRRAFRVQRSEDQAQNSSRLALGIAGIGGAVTTSQDILSAYEAGEIDDEGVMALTQMRERQLDRREEQAAREETRAEREENKRQERQARSANDVILGRLFTGEITAAEANRAAVLTASRLNDSEVAAAVVSTVSSASGSFERLIENSDVVRKQVRVFKEAAEDPTARLRALDPNSSDHRIIAFGPRYTEIVQRASGNYYLALAAGEDPETAGLNAQTYITEQETEMVQRLRSGQTPK